MYDLPSEEVGEPGLPDEYHPLQAQLLRLTFQPRTYPSEWVFSAMDMNIYYDENNTRRYKRPDWFGVVGVPRFYEGRELRKSYLIWQEGVSPFIVVELLSSSTRAEDLGQTEAEPDGNPTKWQVYEEVLQVPYYVIYDGEQDYFRVFHWEDGCYQELELDGDRLGLVELGLGLRLWRGTHEGLERLWLRFEDASGELIPTEAERERQEKEQAQTALQQLRDRLQAMGLDPDNLPNND
ncbi:Uma2 family endonuclease [Spirulina sp. 06S082]|uniref:Uma2 family endonuclease n=1 Tax=Spirulina sp. 06S082 TaxID=3110248 RepID=UPI002B21AF7C|nr:Uma2 family endonuclease [Spirulina sp. 06S082]MEA5469290.1 Uma2 family endonuclease [Spirulina sp. 06S082]